MSKHMIAKIGSWVVWWCCLARLLITFRKGICEILGLFVWFLDCLLANTCCNLTSGAVVSWIGLSYLENWLVIVIYLSCNLLETNWLFEGKGSSVTCRFLFVCAVH